MEHRARRDLFLEKLKADQFPIDEDKLAIRVEQVGSVALLALPHVPGNPRYILDLLKRIVRVSLETMKIVNTLPPLNERK